MLKKLFIRVWAGPLPEWYEKYIENTNSLKKYGFDFMVWNDTKKLAELAKEKLGVTLELEDGSKKAGDVDPLYGIIFEDYIRGYDFWGHTGLDCFILPSCCFFFVGKSLRLFYVSLVFLLSLWSFFVLLVALLSFLRSFFLIAYFSCYFCDFYLSRRFIFFCLV